MTNNIERVNHNPPVWFANICTDESQNKTPDKPPHTNAKTIHLEKAIRTSTIIKEKKGLL